MIRLGFNVDHIATVRNARGEFYPDPVQAAQQAVLAGVDNITCHLREDRRHIRDRDVERLRECLEVPLNLEMGCTDEMIAIAIRIKPHSVTLVPERRLEQTTEGGLNLEENFKVVAHGTERLKAVGILVSLFVEPSVKAVELSKKCGAEAVEFHTGKFCHDFSNVVSTSERIKLLRHLAEASEAANQAKIQSHVGHGINYSNANWFQLVSHCEEANIGHAIVARALFVGLNSAIVEMRNLLNNPALKPLPNAP